MIEKNCDKIIKNCQRKKSSIFSEEIKKKIENFQCQKIIFTSEKKKKISKEKNNFRSKHNRK